MGGIKGLSQRADNVIYIISKKKFLQQMNNLAKSIKEIDCLYAENPKPDLNKRKILLNSEYKILSTQQTERLCLKSRQKF